MDQIAGLVMAAGFILMLVGGVLYAKPADESGNRKMREILAGNKFVGTGFVVMIIGALLLFIFR